MRQRCLMARAGVHAPSVSSVQALPDSSSHVVQCIPGYASGSNNSVKQVRGHLNPCATRIFEELRRDAIVARCFVIFKALQAVTQFVKREFEPQSEGIMPRVCLLSCLRCMCAACARATDARSSCVTGAGARATCAANAARAAALAASVVHVSPDAG